MIRQSELQALARQALALSRLQADPAVVAAVAAQKEHDAASKAIRDRIALREEVEPGKWSASVSSAWTVAWEKVLTALLQIPEVALAINTNDEARKVIDDAHAKSPFQWFTTARHKLSVVRSGK